MTLRVEMMLRKETKNTVVYEAVESGSPPAIRTVYVEKWAVPDRPKRISLTVDGDA